MKPFNGVCILTGMDLEITEYAALLAALSDPECIREQVLGDRGLDEATFAQIDEFWQTQLSAAMEGEDEGVPPLVVAYSEAFARAKSDANEGVLPFERFMESTREIQRQRDPALALSKLGIALAQYLKANEHWTRRMVQDPALAERFRQALSRR